MELRSGLRLLGERWKLILITMLLATAASGFLTWRAVPQYASQVTLFVSSGVDPDDAASAYQGSLLSQQKVKSYTALLRGQRVLTGVIDRLDLNLTPAQLAGQVTTAALPDTALLTATVVDPSPAVAQRIADAVAAEFVGLVPTLESAPKGQQPAIRVSVVSSAELPTVPVSPRPARNLALAAFLGLILGLGLAVARRSLDTTVKTPDQVEEITDRPVLGTVAFDPDAGKHPLILHAIHGPRAESLRKIRTNLQFVDVDQAHKVVLVTSPVPNEGKSVTACNLVVAIALSQAGKRVLLIDADLRRPSAAGYLGLPGGVGLTSVLVGSATLEESVQQWGDGLFSVLPSGPVPPNPSELLGSQHMRKLLSRLREEYDAVIIDAPPVLPVADAQVTAAACDGIVLVVRHGKTRRDQLRATVAALRNVDVQILGTVLNLTPASRRTAYEYHYTYEQREPVPEIAQPERSSEEPLVAAVLGASASPEPPRQPHVR